MSDYERLACFRHGFRLAVGVSSWNCCLEQRADGHPPLQEYRAAGRATGSPRVGAARCSCRGGLCGRPYRQSSPSRSSKARLDSSAFLFRLPLTR